MALNLKTLATRSMSAVIFVIVLMGCLLWNYYSFSIFFFIVSMLALNEFYKIAGKLNAAAYKIPGFIFGILVYFSFVTIPGIEFIINLYLHKLFKTLLILGPFIILSVGLFSKKENSIRNSVFTIAGVLYSVLPFALLNELVLIKGASFENPFNPMILLGIILLIWSNDTFAYLGGSLLGKNKMIERVSPGKTWEGTAIGVLVTFGLSFLFNMLIYPLQSNLWLILGIAVPVLATIGDLVESKLKREAGIKDSGNIMPGHGGILDRFDSLIFVSPFVYVLFNI